MINSGTLCRHRSHTAGDSGYRTGAMCDAVEINSGLVRYLRDNLTVSGYSVATSWNGSRCSIKPDYHESAVQSRAGYPAYPAAFSLLRPGGVLVAVCLNGPRSRRSCYRFLTSARSCHAVRCLYPCSDDDYSSACLMTPGRGRINACLPVQEKDRAPVALKGPR